MGFFDFLFEKNVINNFDYYMERANKGFAVDQNKLGIMYENGENGVLQNYAKAIEWYRKAADQGHAYAQQNLACMYAEGKGVDKDDVEAMKWHRKAADQGVSFSQFKLGYAYGHGIGVEKNEEEAVKWYKKAAFQGDEAAQYNLGIRYNAGRGVRRDYGAAIRWYTKAAEQGNEAAKKFLEEEEMNYRGKDISGYDKLRYGFTRSDLLVRPSKMSQEELENEEMARLSWRGYNYAIRKKREESLYSAFCGEEIELSQDLVIKLEKQDDALRDDDSLYADEIDSYFQQCGDVYINPKFVTTTNIGAHMIKTSDIFAVSYDLVRTNNPMKSKYLLVFYTYNKLLPCFSTEIVVGIGTKQYDNFGVEGTEKIIPYLKLKYPIKPFQAVRYNLRRDEQFINLFNNGEMEDEVFPAIEKQRGMFEVQKYMLSTALHKEAIGEHFKHGYKPFRTIFYIVMMRRKISV